MNTLMEANNDPIRVERGRYARICIELDLRKRLVPRVANAAYNIVYEGLRVIYFSCGRYGHRHDNCPSSYKSNPCVQEANRDISPEIATGQLRVLLVKSLLCKEEKFGEWMLVGSSRRARSSRRPLNTTSVGEQGKGDKDFRREARNLARTRFAILEKIGDDESEELGDEETALCTVRRKGVTPLLRVRGTSQLMWQEK